jgi:hypothetical protein
LIAAPKKRGSSLLETCLSPPTAYLPREREREGSDFLFGKRKLEDTYTKKKWKKKVITKIKKYRE